MLSAEERGQIYKEQLASIQNSLNKAAVDLGWSELDRGRKPNAGIYGAIGAYHASIQIDSVEVDWNKLPGKLRPETEFTLWCSAHKEIEGVRKFCDIELYWKTTFSLLEQTTAKFIVAAIDMLCEVEAVSPEPLKQWIPSTNPDEGPEFGPPRNKTA